MNGVLILGHFLALSMGGKLCTGATCNEWFSKSGLKAGPGCLAKCEALRTGMDTFLCHDRCKDFCSAPSHLEKTLARVAYYPGLTPGLPITEGYNFSRKPFVVTIGMR